jgi:hypothetical protein
VVEQARPISIKQIYPRESGAGYALVKGASNLRRAEAFTGAQAKI